MLPRRLQAPPVEWQRDVDVVVLGSGAAGFSAALAARPVRSVLVVTKDVASAGSTQWAQGGLAGVLDPADTIENHVRDTLAAGAGLCDEAVVRELIEEAPKSIRYLMRLGAAFDPSHDPDSHPGLDMDIALTREGGHSHDRIVHSGGDQSGAEVQRTLDESAFGAGVEVMNHTFALDLVMGTGPNGPQCAGVKVARIDANGDVESVGLITARAVVIACGGYGQVFASTSNPPAVTGDGIALALRAGLAVRDLEFVQFHPTVLWRGRGAIGQQALISEAVRGEGAILYDAAGERIMQGVHPQEDLAPRDIVSAQISKRMAEAPAGVDDHVYLDATHMGERFHERFPSITEACLSIGIDPATDLIPVAPAAHYSCGGITATLDGVTDMPGLFAVGEVTSTGVHGANRLASNSLTESVVAGTRVGRDLAWELPTTVVPDLDDVPGDVAGRVPDGVHDVEAVEQPLFDPRSLLDMKRSMSRHVGVVRSAASLAAATEDLAGFAEQTNDVVVANRKSWEATNLLTMASAIVAAAQARSESRGCHRRSDHPETRPVWVTHLGVALDDDGGIDISGVPADA